MTRGWSTVAAVAVLALCASCSPEERSYAECTVESTLSFDGRVYDGVGYRFERPWRELRVGRRVGTGEMPTCRSSPRRVGVSAVVGCDVRDVVVVRSEQVLMVREELVAEGYAKSGLDRVCRKGEGPET